MTIDTPGGAPFGKEVTTPIRPRVRAAFHLETPRGVTAETYYRCSMGMIDERVLTLSSAYKIPQNTGQAFYPLF
nr:hypothetical protein BgiMline_027224 [Biomphalaria glabrata]